jgi:alkaline phosphatase D
MPDGPDKTIWGSTQKAWFKRTVQASDATFKVLVSPTPIVGPDRPGKHDNLANAAFAHEGNEIRQFIATQKNLVVVCGDRHWQYFSVDPKTGVREYSCGPASNRHAGGWSQKNFHPDIHRFLKVAGGFLSGTVERREGRPRLTIRFHAVDGAVRFTDVIE